MLYPYLLLSVVPPRRRQALAARRGKFNLISTLPASCCRVFWPEADRKALTLQDLPSIRPAMAAGAIPPPLFFEHRRHVSMCHVSICAKSGILDRASEKHISVGQANVGMLMPARDRSLSKDI
jgi:hypothetical protein